MVDKEIGVDTGVILSDGDSGCLDHHHNVAHVFDENRDYYYPIPTKERQLNPNLKQNPGWNDGLSY
jgi:SusD family.